MQPQSDMQMCRSPKMTHTAITDGSDTLWLFVSQSVFLSPYFLVEKKNDFGIFSPVEIGERMN